jgi:hypothetical protein
LEPIDNTPHLNAFAVPHVDPDRAAIRQQSAFNMGCNEPTKVGSIEPLADDERYH